VTTEIRPGAPVLVGVDGSAGSLGAVGLAARLADERARPLRVVHVFTTPVTEIPLGDVPGRPAEGGATERADRILAEAVALAVGRYPDLDVKGEVIAGQAAPVLLDEAADAAVTVVGDRGRGGFTGLLTGSVAVRLAAHADRPVVIARGDLDRRGDVVVGVDGSPRGADAVGFAFEEAALSGVGLTLVHAYRFPVSGAAGDMLPLVYDAQALGEEEAAVLGEAVAGWRERYPEVPVRSLVVRDQPARALVHTAERARLVVVGSRGLGGFTGLRLGAVSHAVLHHASCPVAIVH
jgi:nucleotide-binding universal stress UspA family protein